LNAAWPLPLRAREHIESKLKETTMKFLTMTIAALSIAAVTSAAASVDPAAVGGAGAANAVAGPAKAGYLIQAQRYRKCQEDLGYGRTGNFGCGG
jgi:hypothetical protein